MKPLWTPDRRILLAGLAAIAADRAFAHETAPIHLNYRRGRLTWSGGETCAAAGKGGVKPLKREGDGASPQGDFPLISGYYRADRLKIPATAFPMRPMREDDAWVDDPKDEHYNAHVRLPYRGHVENLWRKDEVYDLVIVVGYNTFPVAHGAGSAIFLHIARPAFTPTVGCIAVSRDALVRLLPKLSPESRLRIDV